MSTHPLESIILSAACFHNRPNSPAASKSQASLSLKKNRNLRKCEKITLGSETVTPSSSARNLGVTMDDELSLTAHIAEVSRSCRFTLYNIQKIRRYLSEHSTQLLVQACPLQVGPPHRSRSMRNPPSPEDSERSGPPGLQPTQTLPCYPAPHLPSLAAHHGPYQIQDPGTDLPSGERDCTRLHKVSPPALHPHPSPTVFF